MQIRHMTGSDLDERIPATLGPAWSALRPHLSFYVGHPACHPIVAEANGIVVGVAAGIQKGTVGWLGHIFVPPAGRRQGIGSALTRALIEDLEGRGCRTLLLVASSLGRPIYERLGFAVETTYHEFVERPLPSPLPQRSFRPVVEADLPELLALDRAASGEDRSAFLTTFLHTGWTRREEAGGLQGFCLAMPWSDGPVVAASAEAGQRLLALKLGQLRRADANAARLVYLPAENLDAHAFLTRCGYADQRRLPRMRRGEPLDWRPAMLWGTFSLAMG